MSLAVKTAKYGAGDPGLFGSIWGGIKKVTGITKHIPGPVGWVSQGVQKLGGSKAGPARPPQPVAPGRGVPQWQPQQPAPGLRGAVQRLIPGGQTGYLPATTPGTALATVPPKGHHLNETDYFLKDGTFVPAGSRWVKNRRRNPLNPGAASKAIARIEQLKRATKRFGRITIRKKCCD